MSENERRDPAPALAAADRFVEHLLAEVERGLRRPLWSIMATARLLLRSRDVFSRDARLVDPIDAAAHRLAQATRDLLDQALAQAGRLCQMATRP